MPSELAHFYSRTREARKVIVVDLGFLGDTVHLIPALWELKSAYPGAGLQVATTPLGAEVLQMVACVERAWPVELRREHRTIRQQWQIVRELRREHFDVAFNFSGADRTLFLTALTGARAKVAYPGGRQHFWNSWLIRHWAARQPLDMPVFEQRRKTLAACGLSLGPVRFDLQPDAASVCWAAGAIPEFAMHISLSSSKPTREWPLEHHGQMLRQVWQKYPHLSVVVSSGTNPREKQRLQAFAELLKDSRLQVLRETISVSRLAAMLQRCRLHLGPDSGVLHLAVALGRPTVSLFREQGAFKCFMPVGAQHRVASMPCHCIDGVDAPCESLGYGECFARINPLHVAQLVTEAFDVQSSPSH